MPGIAGKKARVKVSIIAGGAGAYNYVTGIKSISHSVEGGNLDDSEFGVDYAQRIQGLKDGKLTLSGHRRPADANGPERDPVNALFNDNVEVWIQVLPDDGATANIGFKQQMKVAKFGSDAAVDGENSVSIELEGSGVITLV
jgi:predicted secreted protein